MKESIFNIYTEVENKKLLFNSLYCGLCEIDDDFFSALKNLKENKELNSTESEIVEKAVEAGFFVSDDEDELAFLQMLKLKEKFDEKTLLLTIAPTLACNFECVYCYEDNKRGVMTQQICDELYSFIEKKANKLEKLRITWYGGEPLLARQIIYELSEKICTLCKEKNIIYTAGIITNGSLIEEADIQLFRKYHIEMIQITLDGPAQIHNSRRICKSIDNNFEIIVKKICLLLENNLNVHIRINVDKNNMQYMGELIHILSQKLPNKNVHIGFARVSACTEACAGISNNCFDVDEFSQEYFSLYELIKKYGFAVGTPLRYANPRLNYCGADTYNTLVIDSEGYLYKCWHDVGDENRSIGHVKNAGKAMLSAKTAKWVLNDAISRNKCRECKVLPLCMGGCPSACFFNKGEPVCDEIKYNITSILEANYYKEREKGAGI